MRKVSLILILAFILNFAVCLNVNSAVPIAKENGAWEVLISEDFEAITPTYFTKLFGSQNGRTYVNEDGSEGSGAGYKEGRDKNTVVDLKLGEKYTADSSKPGYGLYYNNIRIGQGSQNSDTIATNKVLGEKYMIEFDLCGKTLTGGLTIGVRSETTAGAYNTIRLNPDKLDKDVWYTYRIVVYSTTSKDIDKSTTRVYRKVRDSEDEFVQLHGENLASWTNDTNLDYGIGGSYVNSALSFGVVAHRSYARPFADGVDESLSAMTIDGTTATGEECFASLLDSHYQLDNISVYNWSEGKNLELEEGVYARYTFENCEKYISSPYFTECVKEDGSGYLRVDTAGQDYVTNYDYTTVVPMTADPDFVGLPERFVISFDANNSVKGFPLHFEVYGDGYEIGVFPRYAFYIKSCEETEDKWYSYKVICTGKPKTESQFTFKVYRKEMGSDEPYTELKGALRAGQNGKNMDMDYGYTGAVGRDIGWKNRIRLGDSRYSYLSAYEDDVKNSAEGVWLLDNLTVTGIGAVTGEIDLADDIMTANVNLCVAPDTVRAALAVYDQGVMVGTDMAYIGDSEGMVNLSVNYNPKTLVDPTAKLFVWNGENSAPLMTEIILDGYADDYDGAILDSPIEKEYAAAFTVDWSDPESYKDWTITESSALRINEETGILTFDVKNKDGYYQVERSLKTPDNFDFTFKMKFDDYGDGSLLVKATKNNRNNYQYYHPRYIGMTDKAHNLTHGTGTLVDIGYDWHEWKYEVRGDFCTIYMDGGEVCRFEQPTTGQRSMLRFILDAKLNNNYKFHLGKMEYTPYFPKATLTSPVNNSEFLETEDIVFKASTTEDLEYVDFFVNGLQVGKGYAPDYEYVFKHSKVGTYRISTGVGGTSSGVDSIITVKPAVKPWVKAESETITYGETAKVSLGYDILVNQESVKPYQVTYFVNGKEMPMVKAEPFELELRDLDVGTNSIYARVYGLNRAIMMTDECQINVVSNGNKDASVECEYEANYTEGGAGNFSVGDGYFGLDVVHNNGVVTFSTDEGQKSANLGNGEYKIVVASGTADLYYNGQFAASWRMPKNDKADFVTYSGLGNFEIGGSSVKTALFEEKWSGEGEYYRRLPNRAPNYSLEFDKTDASDETILFYDGEYKIELEIKDGKIHSNYINVETGEVKPCTLEGEATAGYWRVVVAKGLVQVWIDNIYKGSFAAEDNARGPELFRTMSKPTASTFIAVKETNDRYYHVDDFSGKAELASEDYWIEDSEDISLSVADGALKLEGNGDAYLNANSDDVWMKWSAKVSGTDSFYVAPRTFRGPHYHVRAGYDYGTNKWFVKQWSNDYTYTYENEMTFDGAVLTKDVWHDFELVLEEKTLVLKMDGATVIETDEIAMPFWGLTGFGIDGGLALIDNLEYEGKNKVTAGVKSMVISNSVGISEIFKTSTGRVVALNNGADMIYTDNQGETWSTPEKNSYGVMTGATLLQDGRLFRLTGRGNVDYISYVSSDDGKTWTKTGSLNSCREADRRVFRNGTLTQLSNGRIIFSCDETFTEYNSITGIYYTDDFGKTWHEPKTAMGINTALGLSTKNTGYNVQEGMFAELPDGTVRYFARSGLGFIYYMDSKDGGENFGELQPLQLMNSLTSFSVVRDDEDENTYYAIMSYDANTYSYRTIHSPRNRLALVVSYDGMKNWEYAMTLQESGEVPNWDACNHVLKVFDGTIYVNWNNLNGDRRSFVFAIDKSKIRSSARFEEVHERSFVGYFGRTTFEKQCILPKESGTAFIYGGSVKCTVKNGKYDPTTVARIFGTRYSNSNGVTTMALGDSKVVFTEGSSTYTVNGVERVFSESCMDNTYLNIEACAEAFGKSISETEGAYVLWYDKPLTPQYAEDIADCV